MDKIRALRGFMEKQGLSALLIPHTNEFQEESVAPHSDRLKWLTGFTGSAGFLILTQEKAVFFTDGRYILQAKNEISDFYELYNTAQKPPSIWVKENLSKEAKVGYDPWLFTEPQLSSYRCSLVPITPNPIDEMWQDRPEPPQDFIRLHPLKFSGESDESKRKRIGESLKADCVLITACDSIAWLLNIRGNDVPHAPIVHSVCLLKRDGSYDLFVDLNKTNGKIFNHISQGNGRAIEIRQLNDHITKIKGTCQLDPRTTPLALIQTLERAEVPLVRECDPCLLPKAIKNEVELQGAFKAQVQDTKALCAFFDWLKEQPLAGETTELSAAQKLYEFRKKGQDFEDLSFDTISSFGSHGAIIHYHATHESDCPLTRDGLYLLDSGSQYLTGTTDVTRTVALGTPTAEQKDRYTRVLKGQIALATAIFPVGTTGVQLDGFARQYLWEVGCDYDHGTGHGVGSYLNVHEGPQGISKRGSDVALQSGMILSNEPGYYKEGEYGIRIENMMKVVSLGDPKGFLGFETLTFVPFDKVLIEEALLTAKERKWIEDYHEKIKMILSEV